MRVNTYQQGLTYQSFTSWFSHGEDNFYLAKNNKELDLINGSITRPNMQLDSQVQPGNLEKYEVGILLLHFSQITRTASLWTLSLSLSFCSSFSFSLVSLSLSASGYKTSENIVFQPCSKSRWQTRSLISLPSPLPFPRWMNLYSTWTFSRQSWGFWAPLHPSRERSQ